MKIHLKFAFVLGTVAAAQTPAQDDKREPKQRNITINGNSGQVSVVQINGKYYLDAEALVRLTNGSVSFQQDQVVLVLPSSDQQMDPSAKKGFSTEFIKAGIEAMTAIREWRISIIRAIQSSLPLLESWIGPYRSTAESKLLLASAMATTDSDRNAYTLLSNEFNNMKKLNDNYVALRANSTFISQDDLDNNQLDQQILACARGLAALAASGQFQDVPSCH